MTDTTRCDGMGKRERKSGLISLVGSCLAVVVAAAPVAASVAAHGPTRSVLVSYSLSRMQPVAGEGGRAFNLRIRTSVERPVLVFDEPMDGHRFGGPAFEATLLAYLRQKGVSHRPDLLAAAGEEAFTSLLRHRGEVSVGIPIVRAGVSGLDMQGELLGRSWRGAFILMTVRAAAVTGAARAEWRS